MMLGQRSDTRVLLYPVGTEDEIEFATFVGAQSVPAVGDRVQVLDGSGVGYERGPMYEVMRRDFYSKQYGNGFFVVEVALTVMEVET